MTDRRVRVAALVGAGSLVLVLLVWIAAGALARSALKKKLAERGLVAEVGSLWVGLGAVHARDLALRPADGANDLAVDVLALDVDLSLALRPTRVRVRGAAVRTEGSLDALESRWVRRREATNAPGPEPEGPRPELVVKELSLEHRASADPGADAAHLRGAWLERVGGLLSFGFDEAEAHAGALGGRATACRIELAGGSLRRFSAETLDLDAGEVATLAARVPGTASAPGAALTPGAAAAPGAIGATGATGTPGSPTRGIDPLAPPPLPAGAAANPTARTFHVPKLFDTRALRARVQTFAALLAERLPESATVVVARASLGLAGDGPRFKIGPGPLRVDRIGDRVELSFSAGGDGATPEHVPLSTRLGLPLGPGPVRAEISGGPLPLSTLGISEGALGLRDLARSRVEGKVVATLDAAGDRLELDLAGVLRNVTVDDGRLALAPIRVPELVVRLEGALDASRTLVVEGARLELGSLRATASGTVRQPGDDLALDLALAVEPAACQALLDSVPPALVPTVQGLRLGGTWGAKATVKVDTQRLDDAALEYRVDERCRVLTAPPRIDRDVLTGRFAYAAHHPDGTVFERDTGPGSASWIELGAVSPFVVAALLTTEDGAFYTHHGFNHFAIRESFRANVKAGRFVRGASTLTMQLAKNLFLARDKTLARKLEELVLAYYLEETFSKDELLELYVNVVEFGPDVYGVREAAAHYYGRDAEELTVAESYFLASILPSPVRYHKLAEKAEPSDRWYAHLATLMKLAAKRHKLTDAERDEGLGQRVVFHREGDPRPEPRSAPSRVAPRDARGGDPEGP